MSKITGDNDLGNFKTELIELLSPIISQGTSVKNILNNKVFLKILKLKIQYSD